ncbi:MAG: aspartate aminotransferase family protein [Acidobacteriota bacterium]
MKLDATRDRSGKYALHVNPAWVRLLNVLGMNTTYVRCQGSELETADGRLVLDFLSGYCVYNMGHNHPDIIAEIEDELRGLRPHMLQSHVSLLAGELAERLCDLAGRRLKKVFFTSSGSEGIETVIKFARAVTGRDGLLYCRGAFHGLTNGALSLMGDPWWREGFGPLLPHAHEVEFGDIEALEEKLATRRIAVFLVEPVQAEAGIRLPPDGYLREAQALCHRHGTLFALDEVQTGLFRTGPFLAAHNDRLDPDMVVLAKALSGGLIPTGAVLMSDAISRGIYSSLSRSFIQASTFGENNLSMRAGLATLRVLEKEKLGDRARVLGEYMRRRLTEELGEFEMIAGVRGLGLLDGIVFRPPHGLKLRTFHAAFTRIHPGMFGQMVVSDLFRGRNILTQICGNNHMVLKAAPPLVVTKHQVDRFVGALRGCMQAVHKGIAFWKGGLAMIPRSARA